VDESENVLTVRRLFSCFGQGDITGAVGLLRDNVEWHVAGRPEIIPWAGTHLGQEQVARFFTILAETVELQVLELRKLITQDDTVVVLGHEQSRVKPTDRICKSDWVMVFTLRDGQITRFREYHDTDRWVAAYAAPAAEASE
jgi:ketosteroid isomerase-like protein